MSELEVTESKVLEKAMSQGYNPDFDGEGKKTPEQFIADGEKIAGVQTKLNKELKEEIQSLKAGQKEFFEQQFKMNAEAKEIGYQKALKEIKDKKFDAASEANTEAVKILDKQEDKLREDHAEGTKKTVTKEEIVLDPEFNEWHKSNKWYKELSKDPSSLYAEAILNSLKREGTDLKGKALYDKIKADVKLVFPDIDGKKAPNNLDFSDHSGNDGVTGKELPTEAKKALKQQIKSLGLTKEEQETWKKQYWGQNE